MRYSAPLLVVTAIVLILSYLTLLPVSLVRGKAQAAELTLPRYDVVCSEVACIRYDGVSGSTWALAGSGPQTWRWIQVEEE